MAVYNELQVGRYVRLFQKFFGIKGRQPAPLTFSGEVGAVLSLFHGIENRYLEGWDRYGAAAFQAGVAAQNAAIKIRNPVGSNTMAVLEKCAALEATAADTPSLQIGPSSADYATAVVVGQMSKRGRPSSTCIVSSSGTGVAGVAAIGRCAMATNTTYDFIGTDIQEIELAPGVQIQIFSNTVNQQIGAAFMWRERAMEESELT
jgi:hypothetical protein